MSGFNKIYEYEQKFEKAKILIAQSRGKEAEKILKECYKYYDDENLTVKKLDIINYLVDLYLTLKEYNKVEFFLKEYESETKEHGIMISSDMFHNYGRFYSAKGDIEKSINNYKKAVMDKNPLKAAISYLNLGEKLREIGDFDQASIAFIKSRDIFLKQNKRDLSMKAFIALTEMLIKLRGRAIPVDLNSMEFILAESNFPKSPTLASSYINVGLIFQEVGNYKKSIYYLEKAVEISKEINFEDTIYHAYLNLGFVFENLQEYSKAINYIEQALQYFKTKENNEQIAKAYYGLALINKSMSNFDKAISYIKYSIDLSKDVVNFELKLRNHELLAVIHKNKKDYKNSFLVYAEILKIYKNLSEKSNLLGLKQIFREQFSRILYILEALNELLRTQQFEFQSKFLDDLNSDALNICKTITSGGILEYQQIQRFKEEIKKLNKEINIYKTLLNNQNRIDLENNIINDICKKISNYQAEDITPARIKSFLLQISDPILRHNFLVKVLSRIPIYYYTKELMYRKLKELIENLPFDEKDELIFGVMSETWNKSQSLWSYFSERSISRQVKTEIKKVSTLLKYLLKTQKNKKYFVLFLDDVIGSGKQFIKYYKKEFETRLKKYPILDKKNIEFYLITGVISQEAFEFITENSIFKTGFIKYDKIIKKSDRAFYDGEWENKEILSDLKKFLYKIDPHNWDGWKEDPDKENGMEYLVVLDWRTPNNTIGILWNNKTKIKPLFPR